MGIVREAAIAYVQPVSTIARIAEDFIEQHGKIGY
jgi:hypothetical protein